MASRKPLDKCPRLWAGDTVFIIGGGTSVKELDLTPLHDRRVIGVNAAFSLGAWIDICFFLDHRFYNWNREALDAFPNPIYGALGFMAEEEALKTKINSMGRAQDQRKLSRNPSTVAFCSNSGSAACNLAVHLGASVIVLIGFDMKTGDKGKHNWHDKHEVIPPQDVYQKRYAHHFADLKQELDAAGIECYNANPDSALTEFRKIPYKTAIKL